MDAKDQKRELRKNVPDEVLSLRRFLVWKYVEVPGRKPRKIPFYANGRTRGGNNLDSPEDLDQLVAIDEALAAAAELGMDGIGVALTGEGVVSFDLDDCLGEDGQVLKDHAGAMIIEDALMLGAYIEVSPSGKGLRIFGSGTIFEAYSKDKVEYWGQGRYVTITGRVWANPKGWIDLTPLREPLVYRAPDKSYGEAGLVTRRTIDELRDALKHVDSDERDTWVRMGHALKELEDRGLELWLEWSKTSPKYDEVDALRVWESLRPERTGYRAVFAEAQREGWENPRKKKAQRDDDDPPPPEDDDEDEPDTILSRAIDLGAEELLPTEFVLDGFLPTGVSLIAGAWGAGKSTNLIPLFASVAHLAPEDWGFRPALRRHVLWITEAPDQARDTLYSLAKAEGSESWEEFKRWFHLLPARRTAPKTLAKAIAKAIPELTYENEIGFQVNPVVVLDTTSANFDLENESDNSEVGAAIAALKERLPKVSIVLVGHTPKAAVKADVGEMTFRGAGAWEADSVAVYYLVHDQETDMRFMAIRKNRFAPDYTEVSFGQAGGHELVPTPWGEPQSKKYLHGVPQKSDGTERKEAKAEALEEKREAQKERTLTDRQSKILDMAAKYAEQQKPLTQSMLRDLLGGKTDLLREASARLIESGLLRSVPPPDGVRKKWNLGHQVKEVLLPGEVDPDVFFDAVLSNEGDLL